MRKTVYGIRDMMGLRDFSSIHRSFIGKPIRAYGHERVTQAHICTIFLALSLRSVA